MRAWFEGRKPLGISIDGCVLSRAARDRRAHDGILAHIPRRHDRGADRYRGRAIAVAERSPEEAVLGRRSRDDETSFYIDVGPGTYVFSSGLRLPPRAIALSHVYIKRLSISEHRTHKNMDSSRLKSFSKLNTLWSDLSLTYPRISYL